VQPNNGVGLVRFDEDVHPGLAVTKINTASLLDPDRVAVLAAVQAPMPAESVGDSQFRR
jgi:hypothetical protein